MGRKCVVPECKSGLKTNTEKVSMFSIPKNKLDVWQKALPTKQRQLTYRDSVCVKHFRETDIIREIKTEVFTYQLQVPKLKPDAIPCIFPILSNYQLRPRTEGKCVSLRPEKIPRVQPTKARKPRPVVNLLTKQKQTMAPKDFFNSKLKHLRRLYKDQRNLTPEKYKQLVRAVTLAQPTACILQRYKVVDIKGVKKLATAHPTNPLYYVHDNELFEVLNNTHVRLGHANAVIMMAELKKNYKNIIYRDVVAFRRTCKICKPQKPKQKQTVKKKKKVEGEEIMYSDLSRRCSVNILNYQWRPSGDYAYVMIYQNYMTKFCLLRALQTDTPVEVAENLVDIFTILGVSEEIESSIGSQFWRSVAAELKTVWPEYKPTHYVTETEPAIISLINTAINEWMENNNSTKWAQNLSMIQLEQNHEHNNVETSPYETIFALSEELLILESVKVEESSDTIFNENEVLEETQEPTFEEGAIKIKVEDQAIEDEEMTFDLSQPTPEKSVVKAKYVDEIVDEKNPSNGYTVCVGCGAVSLKSEECPGCFKKRFVKKLLPSCYYKCQDRNNLEQFFTAKLQLSRKTYHSGRTLTKENYENLIAVVEEGTNYQISLDYQVIEREGVKRLVKTETKEHTVKHYVHDDELFFVLHYTHINLRHAWRERMMIELKKRFVNIVARDIMTYLNACPQCNRKRLYSKADREPVIYSDVSAHCSINFVDYHLRSDGGYKYVLVYQNHLTKFYMFKALFSLKPSEVAYNLIDIFTFVGVPTIIESNEDWTFVEDVIRQLKFVWEDLEIMHLKSEEYDGIRVVDEDIRTWMEENKTVRWTKGLRFVQLTRNQEYHSEIEGAPYDAFFGISNAPYDECENKQVMETDTGIIRVLKALFPLLHKSEPPTKDNTLEEVFISNIQENRLYEDSDNYYLSKQKYNELLHRVTAAKVTKQTDILKTYGAIFFEGAERLILPLSQEKMRLYVHDDDLFTVLHYIHTGLHHAGTIKMSDYLKSHFVNISPSDILTFCKLCPACIKKYRCIYKTKAEYMASSSMSLKCSVDIINFGFYPDGPFKYVMVYENCQTKFCVLKPMKTKTPYEVAEHLMDILTLMGACEVIQSREVPQFIQRVITLTQSYWFDSNPKYGGVSSGALEDIENEINTWMVVHESTKWSKILPSIQLAWNKSIQNNMERTPYDDTFK